MKRLFDLAGRAYGGVLRLISPWHSKAKQIVDGRAEINSRLQENLKPNRPTIWLHAASLGEFEQGRPVLEQIHERFPEYQIVVSFFSPSGYNIRKDYSGADAVVYLPEDSCRAVEEFITIIQPTIAIFVKYDLWPTMLSTLKSKGIRTYLISAIFRPTQLFFRPWGKWYLNLLHCFSHVFVQDEESRVLLHRFGVSAVSVSGDTRFDRVVSMREIPEEVLGPKLVDWLSATESQIVVAGSTWPADEELLLAYLHRHPQVKMIIAPHEVPQEHIEAIETVLSVPSKRLSQLLSGDKLAQNDRCLIIDTIGHLSKLYRYGHVAYIGGGFGRGIHNTLEAVVYAIPVVMGPRMEKFREAQELVALGGGFVIDSQDALDARLDTLLQDNVLREQAGAIAIEYVLKQAGATERIVSYLSPILAIP